MSLPEPKSLAERNRQRELEEERQEAARPPQVPFTADRPVVTLPPERVELMTKFTMSPIRQSAVDRFDDLYQQLRRQRRSLKRYQLAEALLEALDDEVVLQAVIARIK